MKKVFVLTMVLVMMMAVSVVSNAGVYDHDVDIDVTWTVHPAFFVSVVYDTNFVHWDDSNDISNKTGEGWPAWEMNFETKTPEVRADHTVKHINKRWIDGQKVEVTVASNQGWEYVITKPKMENDRDNSIQKSIRLKNKFKKRGTSLKNTTFQTKTSISRDFGVGIYDFDWTFQVPWEGWETPSGNYTADIVLQFNHI